MTDAIETRTPDRNPMPAAGEDPLTIAGRAFGSRLLLGTGGFTSHQLLADAIEASATELVTVALRRIDPAGLRAGRGSLIGRAERRGCGDPAEHGRLPHGPRRGADGEARARGVCNRLGEARGDR